MIDDGSKQNLLRHADVVVTNAIEDLSSSQVISSEIRDEETKKDDYVIPDVLEDNKEDSSSASLPRIWSRTLRVKVTANNGVVKLDVGVPVTNSYSFMNYFSSKIEENELIGIT